MVDLLGALAVVLFWPTVVLSVVLASFGLARERPRPLLVGIVKLSRIRLTDPQDDGLKSRREPGMLGVDHRDSA